MTILTVLILLALGVASLLAVLFMRGSSKPTSGQFMNPLAGGTRYRDGAVTYNQSDGRRYHIELEGPPGLHSARYRRRHPPKQRKSTKPWMK